MFTFNKRIAGRFDVFASVQSQGDTHLKRFGTGVTPLNQKTINVYAKGDFLFTVGQFSQPMPEGSCTLDLVLSDYPAGEIATETVVSQYGLRYCASPSLGGSFDRSIVQASSVSSQSFLVETLVFVLEGSIEVSGVLVSQGAYVLVRAQTAVTGQAKLLVLS